MSNDLKPYIYTAMRTVVMPALAAAIEAGALEAAKGLHTRIDLNTNTLVQGTPSLFLIDECKQELVYELFEFIARSALPDDFWEIIHPSQITQPYFDVSWPADTD